MTGLLLKNQDTLGNQQRHQLHCTGNESLKPGENPALSRNGIELRFQVRSPHCIAPDGAFPKEETIMNTLSPSCSKPSVPLHMVEMVFPNTTNHYGTLFGGKVLDLMDRAAFLVATRFTGQTIVTASTEHIDFFVPVKSGDLVELIAEVVYTGRTSLSVRVDLYSENPIRQTREHASQGYFHMVAVNAEGQPIGVPSLKLENVRQQEEWDYVQQLRAFRQSHKTIQQESVLPDPLLS